MLTLNEVIQKTGLKYRTVIKYRSLGILPKPYRVWRGRKGSKSLYPDETVDIINRVKLMKKLGISLSKIADQIRRESDEQKIINPTEKLLIPFSTDAIKASLEVYPDLETWVKQQITKQMPDYELDSLRMDIVTKEGQQYLRPIEITVKPRPKNKELQ
jgi:DNA-binding transcriptional MerR regulator